MHVHMQGLCDKAASNHFLYIFSTLQDHKVKMNVMKIHWDVTKTQMDWKMDSQME